MAISSSDFPLKNQRFVITNIKKEALSKTFERLEGSDTIISALPLINGFLVEANPNKLSDVIASIPKDANIILDKKVHWLPTPVYTKQVDNVNNTSYISHIFSELNSNPDNNINKSTKKNPFTPRTDISTATLRLEKVWDKGFNGEGIDIYILDTGIFPHKDFEGRLITFKDFVNGKDEPYDDDGHGTHVAGCAAGSGKTSNGKFKGAAFKANIISVKVLDEKGDGTFSNVIQGIQWAVEQALERKKNFGTKGIINMSYGWRAFAPYQKDPVAMAVEKATEQGVICVIAAGNDGPGKGTILTPGIAPSAVTIGAINDKNTSLRSDDDIASFSSRGPTIDQRNKPDFIMPGVNIMAPSDDGKYVTKTGTSMATPIMSGVIALIMQANPSLTPAEIKDVLAKSTVNLQNGKYDENTIGKGMVEPEKAVELALELAEPRKELLEWGKSLGYDEKWINENFTLNSDKTISIHGDLDLSSKEFSGFPFKIKEVNGDLNLTKSKVSSLNGLPEMIKRDLVLDSAQINSLEGMPKVIGGSLVLSNIENDIFANMPKEVLQNLDLSNSRISSLEGFPEKIGGNLYFSNTQLVSLKGLPKEINGDLFLNNVPITSLTGLPLKIGGDLNLYGTKITSLEGMPEEVGGLLVLSSTLITSLKGLPKEIGGSLSLSNIQVNSLEGLSEKISDELNIRNTNITSLEGFPKEVGGSIDISKNHLTSLKGLPTVIKGDLDISKNPVKSLEELPKEIYGNLNLSGIQATTIPKGISFLYGGIIVSKEQKELLTDAQEKGYKVIVQ